MERSSCCLTHVHLAGEAKYTVGDGTRRPQVRRVSTKICSASARSMSKSILVPSIYVCLILEAFRQYILPGNNISNLLKLGESGCVDVGYREVVHKANLSEVTERLTGPSTYLPTAPLPPPPSSAPSSHEPPLF